MWRTRSDVGSTLDRIAVSCLTGDFGKTTQIAVTREGPSLGVTIDEKEPLWMPLEGRCIELHGLAKLAGAHPRPANEDVRPSAGAAVLLRA